MEEAAAVRRAASEATADVEPHRLRDAIDGYVAASSAVPGVVTVLSGRQAAGDDPEHLTELAAAVQLVYEGLRLTRELVHEDPWRSAGVAPGTGGGARTNGSGGGGVDVEAPASGDDVDADAAAGSWSDAWGDDRVDPDVAILAADVLVSRGFYVLARTPAAQRAIGVVRAFGRDQTERETAGPDRTADLDRNLERDVLELAVATGLAAAGGDATDDGVAARLAAEFAPEEAGFGPAASFVDDGFRARLAELAIDGGRPLNRND